MRKRTRYAILAVLLCLSLSVSACGGKTAALEASPAPAETAQPPVAATPLPEPAAEPTPQATEAPAAYDTAAYQAAREALFRELGQVLITEPAEFHQEEHPEIPWYSIVSYLYYRDDGVKLYYGSYDFDQNGVPELVLATGDEGFRKPIGIYAFDGSKLLYLCKELALGERSSVSFDGEGLFTVTGSGGAALGDVIVYRIAEDGCSTQILDWYEYEYQPDGSVVITVQEGDMDTEHFDSSTLGLPFGAEIDYTEFE